MTSDKISSDVDSSHLLRLKKLNEKSRSGKSKFSDWARSASKQPDQVYSEIIHALGKLPVHKSWNVFAEIYNEDTPDKVFVSASNFIDKILRHYGISKSDRIVEAACGTAAISRNLSSLGYKNILAFDESRAMLEQAQKLSRSFSQIRFLESEISSFSLSQKAEAIFWLDFSSNFALTKRHLESWATSLLNNLDEGGILIFDVRTKTGWDIDFFKQKITTYQTDRFQRLWVNLRNEKTKRIKFDVFIRIKKDGRWQQWKREQMEERIWTLIEVKKIVMGLKRLKLIGVYDDGFNSLRSHSKEPGLAYFVLKKF